MNMTQTVRMLRYRWKLAFLTFIIVFTTVFGAMYYISYTDAKNIVEPQEVQETISYKITAIFTSGSAKADETETSPDKGIIDISVYNAVLSQIISDMNNSSTNLPKDLRAASRVDESAVILTVSSSDIAVVELVTDDIMQIFYSQELPIKTVYRSSPVKLISNYEQTVDAIRLTTHANGRKGQILQMPDNIYNALLSLTAAIICALFAVIAREKCDKTIRSIYHLKHTCDIPVLPCISKKPTESEIFSLAESFKHCDAVVLTGVKHNIKSFDLACRLAETVVRNDFPIAIVNLTANGKETEISTIEIINRWKASPAAFFRSESFLEEMKRLRLKYKLILFAAPPVAETSHAISLTELAKIIFLVSFGKDTDKDLQNTDGIFKGNREAVLGAFIVSYIPNEEYIFGEYYGNNN